jgi:hypothetical protein
MTITDLLFIFRERAAMIEFMSNVSRDHAEYLAAKCVRRMIAPGPLPDEILQAMTKESAL